MTQIRRRLLTGLSLFGVYACQSYSALLQFALALSRLRLPRAVLRYAAQGGTAMKTMLGVCSVFIAFVLADAPAALAHWPDQAPHQIA
jgi:hypothetical protein